MPYLAAIATKEWSFKEEKVLNYEVLKIMKPTGQSD